MDADATIQPGAATLAAGILLGLGVGASRGSGGNGVKVVLEVEKIISDMVCLLSEFVSSTATTGLSVK
jgi:hypothetical protein